LTLNKYQIYSAQQHELYQQSRLCKEQGADLAKSNSSLLFALLPLADYYFPVAPFIGS